MTPLAVMAVLAAAAAPPHAGAKYRTDGGDESLPWYKPTPREFPPPGTAHREWAAVVAVDPIDRAGRYRPEREHEESRQVSVFALLPYGTVRHAGAPAPLGDVPPGTRVLLDLYQDRDGKFTRVMRLWDHASVMAAAGVLYKVTRVDAGQGRFWVDPVRADGTPAGNDPTGRPWEKLDLRHTPETRWWKGRGVAAAADLAVGQLVRLNGMRHWPGGPAATNWALQVWLDAESRELAAGLQEKAFRWHVRRRGLPARVDAVDHATRAVTLTLLETGLGDVTAEVKPGSRVDLAVAEDSLRTYEPAGGQGGPDKMEAEVRSAVPIPPGGGSGGTRLVAAPRVLLEGFRPGRVVRVFPSGWEIPILPIEERMPKY